MCGPVGPQFLKPEVKLDNDTLTSCPLLVSSEHLLFLSKQTQVHKDVMERNTA